MLETPQALAQTIILLRNASDILPELSGQLSKQSVAIADLGHRSIHFGSENLSSNLARHLAQAIPDTLIRVQEAVKQRQEKNYVHNMSGLRTLLEMRTESLSRALNDARGANIAAGNAISDSRDDMDRLAAFLIAGGQGHRLPDLGERQRLALEKRDGKTVFGGYLLSDLPQDRQSEILKALPSRDAISRYSHDELTSLVHLRQIVLTCSKAVYKMDQRAISLSSKARRNILWSAPRIGMIMATQLPTWRAMPHVDVYLNELEKAHESLNDLAQIPEDDDWLDKNDPRAQAANWLAWSAHEFGLEIIDRVEAGPSAHRFNADFFRRLPGGVDDFSDTFLDAVAPIQNACAAIGIGGQADREAALLRREAGVLPDDVEEVVLTEFQDIMLG